MIKSHTIDSFAKPHLKHTVFPGSTEVNVDGKLTQCTAKECPYSTKKDKQGRMINSAPFAAYGGFIGTVANHSRNVQAAYDFLSFCNRPENSAYDVVLDDGLEPWRTSQLLPQLWESKLPKYLVSSFLSTTREILNNENVVIDLRIPGAADFITEVGKVVDLAMRDVITVEQAPQALQDAWDAVIEKKGGRETLLPLYRKSLNLPPLQKTALLNVGDDFKLEGWHIALIIVGAVLILVIIAGAVVRARRSQSMYEKQFNNNVIAERCASAIAAMEFEKVEYLNKLENPNGIQKAFMHIIKRIQEYKAYMPQALFAEDDTEDQEESQSRSDSHSKRSGTVSSASRNSRHTQSAIAGSTKVSQQLRMAATKKKCSVFCVYTTAAKKGDPQEICRTSNVILDGLASVTSSGNNGVMLYTSGDYTTITLNAASQCATHQVKACHVGLLLKDTVSASLPKDVPLGMGVATGASTVANCGTKSVKAFMCLGDVVGKSRYLAKTCLKYTGSMLFFATINETATGQVEAEAVGVFSSDFELKGAHQVMYNVLEMQRGAGDEWMYELGDKVNQVSASFAALVEGQSNQEHLEVISASYKEKQGAIYEEVVKTLRVRFS